MIRILAIALVLSGCVATPDTQTQTDTTQQISGRVSVNQDGRRDTGGFDYQLQGPNQQWTLYGPTGTVLGTLRGFQNQAIWEAEDGTIASADSLDQLVHQALGFDAPLGTARYWMQGQRPPGSTASASGFDHLGWTVEWLKYNDAGLPRLISLKREGTVVRLVAKTWK